jgi:hypothetical protein
MAIMPYGRQYGGALSLKRYTSLRGGELQIVFLLGIINANEIWNLLNICVFCGIVRKDNFQGFCRCPLAKILYQAMREVWSLPKLSTIANNGKEWVLHLLDGRPEIERLKILMTLWRIWHVRNEVVHRKPPPPVEASRSFLCSYVESISTIKYYPRADFIKGKTPIQVSNLSQIEKRRKVVI